MLVAGLVVGVGCVAGGVVMARSWVRMFREPAAGGRVVHSDMDRARLTGALLCFFIGVMTGSASVARQLDPAIPAALKWTAITSLWCVLVCAVLHAGVVLFGRPAFLVPPRLRRTARELREARAARKRY